MANSRKSRNPSRDGASGLTAAFERALTDIAARVAISGPGARIGIAFSGGLDSRVLLHLASHYAQAHGIALIAFHVHHGLSPNADAWLVHCEQEAVACGVPLVSRAVDISELNGRGVEEAARIARYQALGRMCRDSGCRLLLTAHHQDDQAETVLLQLMRGAGLPGLSGMAAFQVRHELMGDDVSLARPLLAVGRKALEAARDELALAHVTDESNGDLRYRRNALRNTVSPVLEQHFPGFAALVARSAGHAQAAQSLLQDLAEIDLASCRAPDWNAPLYVPALQALTPQRADNLLRHWLYQNRVQLPSMSRLEEIRSQTLRAASDMHPFFDFGPMTLRRIGNRLELHPRLGVPPEDPVALQWQGEAEIAVPAWRGTLVFEPTEGVGLSAEALSRHTLMLHPRAGQERLKLAANRPSRSLKSLYQEAEIAPWRRLWSPLLYLNGELVFAAGLGMDVRHAVMGQGVVLRWAPA
ncbi:MAG: tRNA lysidine(34) synthetase TilS [Noviherbaspirillum sp.]